MHRLGFLRQFENVLRSLDGRGHRIHVVYRQGGRFGEDARLGELARSLRGLTYEPWSSVIETPARSSRVAKPLRASIDYLHYLDSRFDEAPALRARVRRRAPRVIRWLGGLGPLRAPAAGVARRVLGRTEAAAPVEHVERYLRARQPDLVAVTPFNGFASDEVDIVRAARRLGIVSTSWVASWDHLTTKGVFHDRPERVFVWNATQAREAATLHGLAPEQVVVTGAHSYDHWTAMSAGDPRHFMDAVGLDPAFPYVCYVCSSKFIAPDEIAFVDEWIGHLRACADPVLRTVGVLVRPHPQVSGLAWERIVDKHANVSVEPRGGDNPVTQQSRQDFFDSIRHAAAVVGLNTSAMIEAAVIGRPVLSFAASQAARTRTLHEDYLVDADEGVALVAPTMSAHFRLLADTLRDPADALAQGQYFLDHFVRPNGPARAAADIMVDALEAAAQLSPMPVRAVSTRRFSVLVAAHAAARRLPRPARSGRAKVRQAARVVYMDEAQQGLSDSALDMARRIGASDKPVLVGPWLGEVGFELLYWIPFLRWVRTSGEIDPSRLWIISRGGVAPWYGDLAGHYVELFDLFRPDELLAKNRERIADGRPVQKQVDIGRVDLEILDRILQGTGRDDVELIHPSHMFDVFQPYRQARAVVGSAQAIMEHRPIRLDSGDDDIELPADFIAVKFYGSYSFPLSEENSDLVSRVIRSLSKHHDVVVLDPQFRVDDHQAFPVEQIERVHRPEGLDDAASNLALQSRILGRARLLVGTYGGFSYLGPLMGVDTIGLYSNDAYSLQHLALANRVFRGDGYGDLTVMPAKTAVSLFDCLPGAERGTAVDGFARVSP